MSERHPQPRPQPCAERCPTCGVLPLALVWVHGHGQCARCGQNVEPCCQPQEWPEGGDDERVVADRD